MQRSTGETRVYRVLSAISEEYERDPVNHPSTRELCAIFDGMIAYGQSESELGSAERVMKETWQKHRMQLEQQERDGYRPRSLDEALVFVCKQGLERLEEMRAVSKKEVSVARVGR